MPAPVGAQTCPPPFQRRGPGRFASAGELYGDAVFGRDSIEAPRTSCPSGSEIAPRGGSRAW